MRTQSDTFLEAQEALSSTPFIRLVFTSPDGGTTYDHSSSGGRLIQLEHHEEPYNDYATLYFTNEDNDFPDIKGYYVDIGYGFTYELSDYSSPTPRLWVKQQMTLSAEGQKVTMLSLEGVWDMLAEQLIRTGDPPFYYRAAGVDDGYYEAGQTVYHILKAIFDAVSTTNYTFTLLAYGDEDDGIIDSFYPKFEINTINLFEDALALVKRLIDMTKCYIKVSSYHDAAEGIYFTVVYPEDDDEADVTFYSYQIPYFYEYVESSNILIPNHIIVFANAGDDGLWTNIITAEYPLEADQATDEQILAYRDVAAIYTAELIDNQSDANGRAAAIYSKIAAETLSGRLIIPMHCGLELYDKVTVVDTR